MKKHLILLFVLALAGLSLAKPAHAIEGVNLYSSDNGVNGIVGPQKPLPAGIVPTATYAAAATSALSSPTETTIKAATPARRHIPLQCDFILDEDNSTNNLTVELYTDDGSDETTLWVGKFDASAAAGSRLGFSGPKITGINEALKWRSWGQGGITIWADCDYLTIK